MSKVANRTPTKSDNRASGDHRRDSGRGDKSHSRSDSSSRSVKPEKDNHNDSKNDSKNNEDTNADKSGDSKGEKKFTGRCRLFVGNLTPDVTEDDFRKMFEPYGEVSEVFVNAGRSFGFIRLDYRQNAEAAKAALDGLQRKGRILRVRFATHGAALRVKNLHHYVSNELLEQSFSQFGELERAIVIVDDRGKATGEGLVEFVRKPGAQQALRRINEGVFLIGSNPKPIEVEPLEQKDEEDGMPEKFLPRNEQYKKEREKEPRFAPHGSFEYDFGMRWKQLAEMERKGIEQVKKEMDENRLKLEDDMQNALYEYQAEQIRQDLLRQQEELRRLEELRNQDRMRRAQEIEMRAHHRRQEEERSRVVDERRRQEMLIRQQEMSRRSGGPGPGGPMDAPMRREELMGSMRGDGPGFQGGMPMRGAESGMGMRGGSGGAGGASAESGMRGSRGGAPPMQPPPAPPAGMGLERGGPAGQPGMARMPGGGGASGGGAGGFAGQPGMGAGSGGAGAANAGQGMGGSPNINNMGPGGMAGPGGPAAQMDFHVHVTEDLRNKGFESQQWVPDTLPASSGDDGVWLTPTEHRHPDDTLGPRGELDGRVAKEGDEKWDEFLSPNMDGRDSSPFPSLSSTSTSAALLNRGLDGGDSSHFPSHSPSLLAAASLDRSGNNHHHQDEQGQLCPHQQHRQPPPETHLHPAQHMAEATVTSAGQRVMVNHLLRQHYIAGPYMVPPLVRVRRVPGPPVRLRMRWSRRMMMAQESYVDRA